MGKKISADEIAAMRFALQYFVETESFEEVSAEKKAENDFLAFETLDKLKVGDIRLDAENLRIIYCGLIAYEVELESQANPLKQDADSYNHAKHFLPVVRKLMKFIDDQFSRAGLKW